MYADDILTLLLNELRDIPGLIGIVLGGSRARGAATETSDIDLGLYYDSQSPFDLELLRKVAIRVDDEHRTDVLTDFGGWGPRINGGGWLIVQGMHVDFLYRDLRAVEHSIAEGWAGRVDIAYQPGHPHGFSTAMYMSEIALCRILSDPSGEIQRLKALTIPYPRSLQEGIVQRFFWEADFAYQIALKPASRGDIAYVEGCCFRSIACLLQTLFALNKVYWMNEKGALALASGFALAPKDLSRRVNTIFAHRSPDEESLNAALKELASLYEEVRHLLKQHGLLTGA